MIRSNSIGRSRIFIEVSSIRHYFADSLPFVGLDIMEGAQGFIIGGKVLIDKLGFLSIEALAEDCIF